MKQLKKIRLQKLLASNGYGSRRHIEGLITAGEITINGKVASLGQQANHTDNIRLNSRRLKITNPRDFTTRLLVFNKPTGMICTKDDPQKRDTVYDNLPKINRERWIGVGRLDINTSGLYMFTNDGELANLLIQPSLKIPRVYLAKVSDILTPNQISALEKGVRIEGEIYQVDSIKMHRRLDSNAWYKIIVSRGRNHEIRKLIQSQRLLVNKLVRISYSSLTLPQTLKSGHVHELSESEAMEFKDSLIPLSASA